MFRDVAVVDIDMPGLDGLSAAEALHEKLPSCRTLVLTGLSQPGNLLRALKVHVRGFLLKDAPAPQLANAIRSGSALVEFRTSVVKRSGNSNNADTFVLL